MHYTKKQNKQLKGNKLSKNSKEKAIKEKNEKGNKEKMIESPPTLKLNIFPNVSK
jgi:hypothetical protein